jgi:hypothetical protein
LVDGRARLSLFHCKGSHGNTPGRRLGDLYEVLGQAVKSIPWTIVPSALWPELLRRLDHRPAFHVIHGEEQALREQLEQLVSSAAADIDLEVVVVQPGVSVSDLQAWQPGRALLHAAASWCSSESVAFRLLASP